MSDSSPISRRYKCPCCNYPTLTEQSAYEICELCDWEDDGQSESDADQVLGGPNSDYSLTEARGNFAKYRVMYAPGRDQKDAATADLFHQKNTSRMRRFPSDIISATLNKLDVLNAAHIQRINEIVKGKRGVTPETAWLFAQAFGTTPQLWLNLQANHDLARNRPDKEVDKLKVAS